MCFISIYFSLQKTVLLLYQLVSVWMVANSPGNTKPCPLIWLFSTTITNKSKPKRKHFTAVRNKKNTKPLYLSDAQKMSFNYIFSFFVLFIFLVIQNFKLKPLYMFQDDSKSETSVPMYWKQFCWFLKSSTFSERSFYSVVRGMDSTSAGKQGSSPPSLPVYRRCTTLKLYVVRAIVFSATSLESIKLSTLTFRSSSSGIDLKNEKLISVRQRYMLFSIK